MRQSATAPASSIQRAAISRFTEGLLRLIFIGVITQIIYIIYIVAFPLIANTRLGGPAADLEILMRGYRWFAPVYTAGIFLLYYLFWQALKIVAAVRQQAAGEAVAQAVQPDGKRIYQVSPVTYNRLKLFILAFGLLFGFTLVWLYPITANDLFRYVLRGRVWAVHGASPLTTPPNAFPNDPYIAFAGEFGNWVSGYGPLWELLVQVPLRLGAVDMVPGSVSLKLMVLLAYLACAALIGWAAIPEKSSSLVALTFFAWNPLILIQGPGNGHNDLIFMALMVLGIILWQRNLWWAAALALTLSAMAKATGLLILPLFGIVLLRDEPIWRKRLIKALIVGLIFIASAYLLYRAFGPLMQTLQGVTSMLTTRRGFAIASGLRMVLREIIPQPIAEPIPRTIGRYIFILFYAWLLLQLWRNKLNLITAAFLAYFSQLMFGRTFRIWYPMWLIPFAALHFTPATFWRTFLFSLTAELSIINYFVVWRWWLRDFAWGKVGPLSQYWNYWTIMHLLTVPWLFGLPLFGPILLKWVDKYKAQSTLAKIYRSVS